MADSSLTTMMPSALLDEATLDRFLARACRVYADLPAFCCLSHSLSYAQIETLSLQWAAWLQDQGVVPGTRVAVMLPNLLQYPVAIYGILRAGGVVVNCNPLYTPHELEFQLRDAEAEFMLVLENFAHTVQQIHVPSLRHIIVTQVGDLMEWRGHLINGILRYWKRPFLPGTCRGYITCPRYYSMVPRCLSPLLRWEPAIWPFYSILGEPPAAPRAPC